MYRLFVMCDNPKGVVDCGTIRKHRNCSQKMKDKNKVQKTTENLETYKQEKFPKLGSNGNLIIPSSLQFNMINSWSSDLNHDGSSQDITKDLLKGAIDLQDSLIILRNNLHDTSQRKQNEKPEKDSIEAKVIGRTQHVNQFSEQSNPMGSSGSSSNCTVELKRVIKESLVREKGLDSTSETPSTNTTLSDPSLPIITSKMERGHNIVAKLMGLEETSTRSFPSVMQKKLDGEKILKQKKPVFEIDRKLKAEIVSFNAIKHRKGSSSSNLVILKEIVKLEAKGMNPIEESMSKVKLHCHNSHTSQVNGRICKVQTNSRNMPEKDISESRIVARPQDQGEITSTKLKKPKSGSRIHKNEIFSLKRRTYSNTISMSRNVSRKTNNSKDIRMEIKESAPVVDFVTHRRNQMKNRGPVSKPEPAKLIAEKIGQGEKKKSIYVPGKNEEYKRNKRISAEEAHESSNCNETEEMKHFLLMSQTFIGHAEKLFNLNVDSPKNKTLRKDETNGIALYLDCANELAKRKSLQESRVARSFLLTCEGNTRLHITLSELVEEICDAIEKLKCYRENYGVELLEDDLFAMMEKDIMSNGVINGIWEHSWRHGFSALEVEQVVNKIENLLLSGLIEDIVLNL